MQLRQCAPTQLGLRTGLHSCLRATRARLTRASGASASSAGPVALVFYAEASIQYTFASCHDTDLAGDSFTKTALSAHSSENLVPCCGEEG
ncbi:hypothetical protein GCM10009693_21500 [Leucobacter chromiireducens subsp. chromiireducens]